MDMDFEFSNEIGMSNQWKKNRRFLLSIAFTHAPSHMSERYFIPSRLEIQFSDLT